MASEFTNKVFEVVDAADAAGFAEFFTDQGHMVFANNEPLVGPEAIAKGVGAFFGTIRGLRHHIVNEWVVGAETIVELKVTYDRLDGRSVTIPAVSIWHRTEDGAIDHYRVFFDLAPVYAL
jgi:ketosteroid isomerase-like protein